MRGQTLAVVGEVASGKTTLARSIARLLAGAGKVLADPFEPWAVVRLSLSISLPSRFTRCVGDRRRAGVVHGSRRTESLFSADHEGSGN